MKKNFVLFHFLLSPTSNFLFFVISWTCIDEPFSTFFKIFYTFYIVNEQFETNSYSFSKFRLAQIF